MHQRSSEWGVMEESSEPQIDVISSKTGYKGFKVDEKGELVSYSDLYYAQSHHLFNVSPFYFEGKYYAIATKKTGPDEYFSGIIDTSGTPLQHFNFEHKCVALIEKNTTDVWFSVGLCRNLKGSRISFKGERKFQNELVGWLFRGNIFNYNHNLSDDRATHGIFDLNKLGGVLKPQKEIQIISLNYSSKEKLDYENKEDIDKANMYFLVKDSNKEYYMDFSMKKYLPIK